MSVFIKRDIFEELKKHLEKKEITLLIGPRQAGKTTLLLKLQEHLRKKSKKTLFLNLDFDEHKIYFKSQLDLINYLRLNVGEGQAYVFIDEIQRLENAGLFLKGLYDRQLPYKFIVSGSGSLELKEKVHESLVGRKRIFEINTLSFKELVNYKTNYLYEDKLKDFFKYNKTEPFFLLNEYLIFGGYPRVVLTETLKEKKEVIKDIFQSYLEKDIQTLIKLEKKEGFARLVIILSNQIGQLVRYNELARLLSLNQETIKRYLWYLEKTFIIKKVTPFSKNPRKELSKAPVFYFTDLGLRNYSLNQWLIKDPTLNNGFLFQNFVFLLLKDSPLFKEAKINYWRTKDNAEVDFILNYGKEIVPVEVKNADLKKPFVSRSLKSFIRKYRPKEGYIVNKSFKGETTVEGCTLKIIPYWELLE